MVQGEVSVKPKSRIPEDLQHAHGTNAAVTITLPVSRVPWVIHGFSGFYSAAPTGGLLTVVGGGLNYSWPITSSGAGFLPLPPGGGGEKSDRSSAIVVTLSAAGAGVIGYLNIHAELE
jgi:hypothetical protein